MSDIIHKDKKAAKLACEEFEKEISRLTEKLGVWEENDDSCSDSRIYARYYSENGEVEFYCHS